jgi:hypothetical protein
MFVLSLRPDREGGVSFQGAFTRPANLKTIDGWSFSGVSGGNQTEPLIASDCKNGVLSLTFQNPADRSDIDIFSFKQTDEKHALLTWKLVGMSLPAFTLIRGQEQSRVAEDWVSSKTYTPDDGLPSSSEMKRIFDEDQQVRQAGFKVDWVAVNKSDAERRAATSRLLTNGVLHTGEDFVWAAFVFQHGATPNDYLLAHTLAMIAVKKGREDALWIATATLDRYLQSVHQSQIYGTQFRTVDKEPTTQDPYDRTLVSDALRRELGVPTQPVQDAQRKQYDVERQIAK